jgi:Na+/H+ antiporter NhaB
MEHHNILRFLFVCGLITVLLVGILGVEYQQNGFCAVSVSILVTYFSGVAPDGKVSIKTKKPM